MACFYISACYSSVCLSHTPLDTYVRLYWYHSLSIIALQVTGLEALSLEQGSCIIQPAAPDRITTAYKTFLLDPRTPLPA